jgi:hypothetical protein
MSRSIAEALAGNPNSTVAETLDVVVSGDGWSGMTGGFSPATAAPATQVAQNSTRQTWLR